MIARIVDAMFGCRHSNYGFPRTTRPTSKRSAAAALTGTYVACLDCGKELPYDWAGMRVLDRNAAVPNHPAQDHAAHAPALAKHAA
jgi:hypothetical protein